MRLGFLPLFARSEQASEWDVLQDDHEVYYFVSRMRQRVRMD